MYVPTSLHSVSNYNNRVKEKCLSCFSISAFTLSLEYMILGSRVFHWNEISATIRPDHLYKTTALAMGYLHAQQPPREKTPGQLSCEWLPKKKRASMRETKRQTDSCHCYLNLIQILSMYKPSQMQKQNCFLSLVVKTKKKWDEKRYGHVDSKTYLQWDERRTKEISKNIFEILMIFVVECSWNLLILVICGEIKVK